MTRVVHGLLTGWMAVALAAGLWGCESDDAVIGPGGFDDLADVGEEDRAASAAKSAEARVEMERVLNDLMDLEELDVEGIDFTRAEEFYREAIALDPKNTEAQFGAAITRLLALAQDEDVRATEISLNSYLESEDGEELSVTAAPPQALARLPLVPAKMVLAALDDPSTVSDIQETIDEEIVPAIDYALERLQIVEGDSGFTYTITPEMQGDEEADALEVDLGEAYLLDAQLRLVKAVMMVATAYDFDFDDDSDENLLRHIERLDKTGTFLTLKSRRKMEQTKALILEAVDMAEESLAAIRAETDSQDDDLIQRSDVEKMDDEIEVGEEDDVPTFFHGLETPEDVLAKAREILEIQVEIEADFDGDADTPKQTVVFDIGRFFDHPPIDLRMMLPYHEWHLDLLRNRDFTDELVLTDGSGSPVGMDPPLVFPDPSFNGILSSINSNEELIDLLGIEAEGSPNDRDLLRELGIIEYRDGGIIVSNATDDTIRVVYTAVVADEWVERFAAAVPPGADSVDVIGDFHDGATIDGDAYYDYEIVTPAGVVYRDHGFVLGNIYLTVGTNQIVVEQVDGDQYDDTPDDPYHRDTHEF